MTKYTIAIPAYNNYETIRNAIESCLNQKTDIKFDVLVSDDGSTDQSQSIYDEFHEYENFKYIIQESNSSLFGNHNNCLKASDSDYVLFCHADDTLYSDALDKLERTLTEYNNPNKIVCFGRSFFRDFYQHYKNVGELNKIVSGVSAQELFQHGGLTPSGTCYSRESFLDSGGFLPMRTRITPSDISSMIKYSLDGAEFLMIDRLLFKREFASTAVNISKEDNYNSEADAIAELYKVLGPQKMSSLFDNIASFNKLNLNYISILSKYSNKSALKYKVKYILSNPLCFLKPHLIKRIFSNAQRS